jgi:hypothetical protein
VVAGVATACLLPAVLAARPGPRVQVEPARLRELILSSAAQPYQGYVDGRGRVNLPDLPALRELAGLFGGNTRIRAWYASPQAWRVAVLDPTGERDIYQTDQGSYVWDFDRNLVSHTVGQLPLRLPFAADLLPPDLARRLLAGAGPGDRLTPIGSVRVAGVAAAGLRLTPSNPDTTIAWVDVWADPDTGLPVQVQLAGRDSADPVYASRFLDLAQRSPPPNLVRPTWPASAGFAHTTAQDIAATLGAIVDGQLPDHLAGHPRALNPAAVAEVGGVGAYGAGLSTFVVVALPGRVGFESLRRARDAGGLPVDLTYGQGYEVRTSLLTALVVRTHGDRQSRRSYLIAGAVTPQLARAAAADLLATQPEPQ